MKKKFAVIIGHTGDSPGAFSPFINMPEFVFNSGVAKHLEDVADVYFYDSYKYGYRSMVNKVYREINQEDYLLTLELHFNSAVPSANGTEALHYYTSEKGKKYANKLVDLVVAEFNTRSRGVIGVDRNQRGGYALYAGKAPAVLIEPFFGSNAEDAEKFKGNDKKYAQVIKDFFKWVENEN